MNPAAAELYLQCHRSGGRNCPAVEKALRFVRRDSVLKRKLEDQEAFDAQIGQAVHAIQPPEDLKRRLAARTGQGSAAGARARPQFTVPIVVAMACGILSILGLLVVMEMDSLAHFSGREAAERLIDTANGMSGIELEPVSSPAGQLGDWFLLHGFDAYGVPEEFAVLPAVGMRVLRLDGKPVAQVALDRHNSIIYIFRASDFNVALPAKGEWQVFDHDGWAGAISRRNDTCSLVIFRGGSEEMHAFLRSLQKI